MAWSRPSRQVARQIVRDAHDPIGNRTDATEGSTVSSDYTANELNQYTTIRTDTTGGQPAVQRPSYDADGNLVEVYVVGDMNGDGLCNNFDITPFMYATTHTQGEFEDEYPNGCYLCGDINGDGLVNNFDITPFVALTTGGNSGIYVKYAWDAENRLIQVEPGGPPAEGDEKVEFAYDYLGRRIEKKVSTYDGDDWVLTADRRFVWAGGGTGGWLMLMELEDGGTGFQPVRSYTWGLDLAGQAGACGTGFQPVSGAPCLESAGGIGGLLAVHDETVGQSGADYVYTYDANGNVGQLVRWSDFTPEEIDPNDPNKPHTPTEWHSLRLVARYDYDPYGNVAAQSGDYAETNPFRFSTKYWDDETGLGYWGYRYYSSKLGRWMSRDPLGQEGGLCLYAFVNNEPLADQDALGLQGSQPTTTQSSQPTTKQSCCCCCAEDLVYQNDMWKKPGDTLGRHKYSPNVWARYFEIDIKMLFKPECGGGDCAFEWLEEPHYDPDPKNKSHEARSVLGQDSKVAWDWSHRGALPSPCEGSRSIVTFDAPSILTGIKQGDKWVTNTQTFRVRYTIELKSGCKAGVCRCAKVVRKMEVILVVEKGVVNMEKSKIIPGTADCIK
jgi:RHS repeat-associated protein